MGQEKPTFGEIKIGTTVKISYVDQTHKAIDPEKTVFEVVSGGLDNLIFEGRTINVSAYLERSNFTGADQRKKCGVLSG